MLVGHTPPVVVLQGVHGIHKAACRSWKETECFGEVLAANSAFIGFPCGGIILLCNCSYCIMFYAVLSSEERDFCCIIRRNKKNCANGRRVGTRNS